MKYISTHSDLQLNSILKFMSTDGKGDWWWIDDVGDFNGPFSQDKAEQQLRNFLRKARRGYDYNEPT